MPFRKRWHRCLVLTLDGMAWGHGHAVGSIYANSFNFNMVAYLKLKAFKHIQHKFRGGMAFFFCYHLPHIPIFFCSPAPAMNNAKRQRRNNSSVQRRARPAANDTHDAHGREGSE